MKTVSSILNSIDRLIQEAFSRGTEVENQTVTPTNHGRSLKTKVSGSDPSLNPRSYESLKWEERLRGGYKVKFRTGTKLITIFRFLVAKAVYDTEDGLRLDEYLALMESYLRLRTHPDPTFNAKYGEWLITIQPFIASLAEVKIYPLVPKKRSPELERALSPLLPSPSAYHGYKGNPQIRDSFRLIVRNPFVTPAKLPPPRFIGVGYKDKGHRRDPALDGTPRWQDIAGRIPTTDTPQMETSDFSGFTEKETEKFAFNPKDFYSSF
jgi:hypothetical protein